MDIDKQIIRKRNNKGKLYKYIKTKCTVCKKEYLPLFSNYTKGHTTCGCQRGLFKKHGMSNTSTYNIWMGVKNRCDSKSSTVYKWYGAKGISYDKKWKTFEGFLEDMGQRPEGKTLDRIDNSKGYSKENCRWATMKEQQNNKNSNRIFTIKGLTKTMADWCEEYNVNYKLVECRVNKYKWDIEKALTTPKLQ